MAGVAHRCVVELFESRLLLARDIDLGRLSRLDSNLTALYEQFTSPTPGRPDAAATDPMPVLPRVIDGRVRIEAYTVGDVRPMARHVEAIGATHIATFGSQMSAAVPVDRLPDLAAIPSLRYAQPAEMNLNSGTVQSQGDLAQRSNVVRSLVGFDGTGVKIGVLSDSYNNLGGAAANIAAGELPAGGVQVLQDMASGGTDEGRAMLQIIHDVAPGATLLYATAFGGVSTFANNIIALANAGCDIIVDDVNYTLEPMFQDGIVAQAVNTVVGMGVSFFTSANNYGSTGYESVWRSAPARAAGSLPASSGSFLGGTPFDFDPGAGVDDMLFVTIDPNQTFTFVINWDSPNFSVSGAAGSPNDVDLYVLNSSGTTVLFGNTTSNTGGDAGTFVGLSSGAGGAVGNIMIVNRSGAVPGFIKSFQIRANGRVTYEWAPDKGTVFGHQNVVNGMSVGAAEYLDTPAFGVNPPAKESFSAFGTTPILFDTAGTRLPTPLIRPKPDFVAPDGVSVNGFGSNLNPFFGTSAAAPHAAAVAALMLQANPSATPAQIYSAIRSGSIDMDNPLTGGFDAGFDTATGWGLIQADAAVAAILPVGRWTGFGDAVNWTGATNWSQNTVPGAAVNVIINVPVNASINVTGAQIVASVTSTETLNVSGSLATSADSTFAAVNLTGNMTGNASVTTATSLSITGAGRFDLKNGTLIVDYTGADPTTTLTGYVATGRNGGAWNGNGINSSTAGATADRTIGSGKASDLFGTPTATFAGKTVDQTAVLIRYTLPGDATLNGTVDITDLAILATNWQASGRRFTQGNFTFGDSQVDIGDLALLATNWQVTAIAVQAPRRPSSVAQRVDLLDALNADVV